MDRFLDILHMICCKVGYITKFEIHCFAPWLCWDCDNLELYHGTRTVETSIIDKSMNETTKIKLEENSSLKESIKNRLNLIRRSL